MSVGAGPPRDPIRGARRLPSTAAVAVAFLLTLVLGALTLHGVGGLTAPRERTCPPLVATSVARDEAFTAKFAAYGNGNARTDDWTGADGAWSVPLPGGRTLWIFADTFLGPVQPPPNPSGEPYHWRSPFLAQMIRNSAVLEGRDGSLTTLRGSTHGGAPDSWIDRPGQDTVYWPMSAIVEPERPGSRTEVLRVFVFQMGRPQVKEHTFGTTLRAAVATFALNDLSKPRRIDELPDPPRPAGDFDNQVFYGQAAIRRADYVYVFGGTSNTLRPGQSAYLARIPAGGLADDDRWEYWAGPGPGGTDRWARADPARARPVIPFTGFGAGRTGVAAGYSVINQGRTYVLFTMDTTVDTGGIWRIASYWSCSPAGPWHGPAKVYDTPEVTQGKDTISYFPYAHPGRSDRRSGLLLSYDVNSLARDGINNNVALYRPKFLRIKLGQPRPSARPTPSLPAPPSPRRGSR